MKRVLGMGNSLTDILIMLDNDQILIELGYQKGSMNLITCGQMYEIENRTQHVPREVRSGGSAANTIYTLSSLGVTCGYLGKNGADDTGKAFRGQLEQAGVTLMDVKIPAIQSTGRCFVFISPDGERTFATYLGAAMELCADDLGAEQFCSYDMLHIEGYLLQNYELVDKAMALARQEGLEISLDLASYNVVSHNLDHIRSLCHDFVDILFANEDEGRVFTKETLDDRILKVMSDYCPISILKLGARGSQTWFKNQVIKTNAVSADVKDTTGAGDIFAAGFLAGYARGESPELSLEWGSHLASEIIRILGARLPDVVIKQYRKSWKI